MLITSKNLNTWSSTSWSPPPLSSWASPATSWSSSWLSPQRCSAQCLPPCRPPPPSPPSSPRREAEQLEIKKKNIATTQLSSYQKLSLSGKIWNERHCWNYKSANLSKTWESLLCSAHTSVPRSYLHKFLMRYPWIGYIHRHADDTQFKRSVVALLGFTKKFKVFDTSPLFGHYWRTLIEVPHAWCIIFSKFLDAFSADASLVVVWSLLTHPEWALTV